MDDIVLKVDSGALVQLPAFAYHHKHMEFAKNWMAVITGRNPAIPGGLDRFFMERANYPFYYFVKSLMHGDVIEFGADIVSKRHSTKKRPYREYGIVRSLTESELVYAPQPNAMTALALSLSPAWAAIRPKPVERKLVLRD